MSFYYDQGIPVPKTAAASINRPGSWDELRQALLEAEAALGSVFMAVRVQGKARSAKDSLGYARTLLEKGLPPGASLPKGLVEAKRMQMMLKRFLKEIEK